MLGMFSSALLFLVSLSLVAGQFTTCPSTGGFVRTSTMDFSTNNFIDVAGSSGVIVDSNLDIDYIVVRTDGILFVEDGADRNITTSYISVLGQMFVGCDGAPFENKVIFTFDASDPESSTAINLIENNGIGVDEDGVLVLNGRFDQRTWTQLDGTVAAGATEITTLHDTQWAVGDTIVLASTDFNMEQAEEKTISAINGNTITLDSALEYMHYGEIVDVGSSLGTVDERGEVIHLTRNIVVQGNNPDDPDGFGAHLKFLGPNIYLHGVEVRYGGHQGELGVYPVHFHVAEDAPNAVVEKCSVHHSFQRCYVVHATQNMRLTDNVAYDVVGHCFFVEDGSETGNTFDSNVAVLVREGELLMHDSSASCWWVTNPANDLINNRCAGADGKGYWYAIFSSVPEDSPGFGTTAAQNLYPTCMELGLFDNNTAHSIGSDGLFVDDRPVDTSIGVLASGDYSPRDNPLSCVNSTVSYTLTPAEFRNFEAYKCRNRGVWFRGGEHHLVRARMVDNAIGCTFAIGSEGSQVADQCLFIGESDNVGQPAAWERTGENGRSVPKPWEEQLWPIRGAEFYDGHVTFQNSQFYKYVPNGFYHMSALSLLRRDEFSINMLNRAINLQFEEGILRLYFPDVVNDGDKMQVFTDVDGSVSGVTGASIVLNHPFMVDCERCTFRSEWNAWVCESSTSSKLHAGLRIQNLNPSATSYCTDDYGGSDGVETMVLVRDDTPLESHVSRLHGSPVQGPRANSWQATLLLNKAHTVHYNGGTPPEARYWMLYGQNEGDSYTLGVCYKDARVTDIERNWSGNNAMTAVSSRQAVEAGDGSQYYHDSNTGLLWLKFVKGSDATDFGSCSGGCPVFLVTADVSSQGSRGGMCTDSYRSVPGSCIGQGSCEPPPEEEKRSVEERVYRPLFNEVGVDYACEGDVDCKLVDTGAASSLHSALLQLF